LIEDDDKGREKRIWKGINDGLSSFSFPDSFVSEQVAPASTAFRYAESRLSSIETRAARVQARATCSLCDV